MFAFFHHPDLLLLHTWHFLKLLFLCYVLCFCQVLDVDLAEGRIRANFHLPNEPYLINIIRHHSVGCFVCVVECAAAHLLFVLM